MGNKSIVLELLTRPFPVRMYVFKVSNGCVSIVVFEQVNSGWVAQNLTFIPDVGFFSPKIVLKIIIGKRINSLTLTSSLGTTVFDTKYGLFVYKQWECHASKTSSKLVKKTISEYV